MMEALAQPIIGLSLSIAAKPAATPEKAARIVKLDRGRRGPHVRPHPKKAAELLRATETDLFRRGVERPAAKPGQRAARRMRRRARSGT
jgi:hypothetical protein